MSIPFSFLPIPEQIANDNSLSWGAKCLFGILAKTNWEEIKWSRRKLAQRMGVKELEITTRVKELEDKKLIIVERVPGGVNTYKLNLEIIIKIEEKSTPMEVHSTMQNAEGVLFEPHKGSTYIYKKDYLKDIYIQILSFFNERMKQNFRLTESVKEKLAVRLKNYSKEDLIRAIDNFSKNDWWMENNSFRGPAWFFKSDDQIEKFLALKPEKGAHGVIVITNDGKVIHQK